jgi:hypothetical protein
MVETALQSQRPLRSSATSARKRKEWPRAEGAENAERGEGDSFRRHPELVSGSMPQRSCGTRSSEFLASIEAWMLKQVQHDVRGLQI